MLTRNDLQSCANLSPANLCAASSASDLPTWMITTYPSCDLNTTIEAKQDHTRQDTSVCHVYIYTIFINKFIQFVKSLTNQGGFHASEGFLSSSVLSSHLPASDLPGSCWFHLGWYCRHWWIFVVQDRLPY